jgi:PEP-CTERM motif
MDVQSIWIPGSANAIRPGTTRRICKMRNSLWIIALLFAVVVAPNAHANNIIDYTINFTSNQGDVASSGTLEYDSTIPSVTASIVWEGQTFGFSDANLVAGLDGNSSFTGCTGTAEALAFNVLNGCAGTMNWFGDNFNGADYLQLYVIQGAPCGSTLESGYPCYDGFAPPLAGLDVPYSGGTFTLTAVDPTPTPEPSTCSFILLGAGMLGLLMRKRLAQGLPEAG